MEDGRVDATPDLSELQQETAPMPTVPVRLAEAGTVYVLPNRVVQYSTDVVGASPVNVVPGNPKRNRGVLVSIDEPVFISTTATGTGMLWPAGVPYEFHHAAGLNVRSASGASTRVGSAVEIWAD